MAQNQTKLSLEKQAKIAAMSDMQSDNFIVKKPKEKPPVVFLSPNLALGLVDADIKGGMNPHEGYIRKCFA